MNKIQSHIATSECLHINSEISSSENLISVPFKELETDQSVADIIVNENKDLKEILKTNVKQLSQKSSVGSFHNISNTTLPRFKNYDYNFTEQVGINEDLLEPQITQTSEATETDLNTAHLIQTLQGIQYIRKLEYEDFRDNSKCILLPPCSLFSSPKTTKTVIFDLDETLIH